MGASKRATPAQASSPASPKKKSNPLSTVYLFLYNLSSFGLWATITLCLFQFLPSLLAESEHEDVSKSTTITQFFNSIFPLLKLTQSLAMLEIFHSLIKLVRASVVTTSMQVASRLLLVWGVMYVFSPFGESCSLLSSPPVSSALFGSEERFMLLGSEVDAKGGIGQWAFVGCVCAWGVTECIRYGFFALQIWGNGVPSWMLWLRYNTFFVLYPMGICSECTLIYLTATSPSGVNPMLQLVFVAILVVYVPGSYILYSHMMAQRRKVMRAAKRTD